MIKIDGKEIDVCTLVHPSVKDAVKKCFEHPSVKDVEPFSGKIPAEAVAASGLAPELLADALLPIAAAFAYTPVSHFNVGAVSRTTDGDLFLGCNAEYPGGPINFSLHGEQCAIAVGLCSALDTYKPVKVVFASLSVTAEPCGHCRQLLSEQQCIQGAPLEIRVVDQKTLVPRITPLDELLPAAFTPANLNITSFTFDGSLVPPPQAADNEIASPACCAIDAASRVSRAPYSGAYSGAAVEVGICGGAIFTGAYIENAAYSPSTFPMTIALIKARIGGYPFSEVSKGVLMEVPGTVSCVNMSQEQLKIWAPNAKFYHFTPDRA